VRRPADGGRLEEPGREGAKAGVGLRGCGSCPSSCFGEGNAGALRVGRGGGGLVAEALC